MSKLYWSISIIKQNTFSWKSYLIWFDNFWSGYQAQNRIVLALVSPASSLIKAQLFKQLRRVIQWNPYNFSNLWMKWTYQILIYRFSFNCITMGSFSPKESLYCASAKKNLIHTPPIGNNCQPKEVDRWKLFLTVGSSGKGWQVVVVGYISTLAYSLIEMTSIRLW